MGCGGAKLACSSQADPRSVDDLYARLDALLDRGKYMKHRTTIVTRRSSLHIAQSLVKGAGGMGMHGLGIDWGKDREWTRKD